MKNKIMKKIILFVVTLVVCCSLLLTGCGAATDSPDGGFTNNGDNLGGGGTGTVPAEVEVTDAESKTSEAGTIDTEAISADTDASGATALSSDGVISAAGDYLLTGDYPNGITLNLSKKNLKVHLFLNGANVSNSEGSGIIKSDKKVELVITAIDGTDNYISSSAEANAIHVKGSLVVNGSGSIEVSAMGSDASAIKTSGSCIVTDATVKLSSTKHGISAESIAAKNCSIEIEAEKDGLHAECDFDNNGGETYTFTEESGYVSLANVDYNCVVAGDGIQADTFVYINGGNYNITTNSEFVSYSAANLSTYNLDADDFRYIKSGSSYQKVASDYNGSLSNRYALTQSAKGIKVGEIEYDTDGDDADDATVTGETNYAILIESGTITIDSTDDAIHCNSGNTFVNGGTITIDTLDDGITSDLTSKITGGTITVRSSYEGIEGAYVSITGGTIDITSSDDGINAASDDNSISEYIIVSGGDVTVNASGDGIDSNGSILISGGKIVVHGPTSGGDGALDADSGIIVTGGTLYAASTLGMVETPSRNSTQYVISFARNSVISSGTSVSVKDGSGTELLNVTTVKSCQSIILSSPLLEGGKTYYVYIDGENAATVSLSDILTYVGSSGTQGGHGENRPGGGFNGRK